MRDEVLGIIEEVLIAGSDIEPVSGVEKLIVVVARPIEAVSIAEVINFIVRRFLSDIVDVFSVFEVIIELGLVHSALKRSVAGSECSSHFAEYSGTSVV